MKFILNSLFLAQAIVSLSWAQDIQKMVGGAMAFNLTYRHAYASTNGFAAQILVSVPESNGRLLIPMGIEQAGSKLRGDFKLTSFNNIPEQFRRLLEQLKLDELVAIYDLNSERSVVLFPQVRAFLVLPPSADNAAGASLIGTAKFRRKIQGSETVDGVELLKVTLVDDADNDGPLVWEQVKRDHFPLFIMINAKGGKMTMETKSVDLKCPGLERFGIPADYTKYSDLKSLVAAAAQKAGIQLPAPRPPTQSQ